MQAKLAVKFFTNSNCNGEHSGYKLTTVDLLFDQLRAVAPTIKAECDMEGDTFGGFTVKWVLKNALPPMRSGYITLRYHSSNSFSDNFIGLFSTFFFLLLSINSGYSSAARCSDSQNAMAPFVIRSFRNEANFPINVMKLLADNTNYPSKSVQPNNCVTSSSVEIIHINTGASPIAIGQCMAQQLSHESLGIAATAGLASSEFYRISCPAAGTGRNLRGNE